LALGGHRNEVPFLPAQDLVTRQPSPTLVGAGVVETPIGVAAPATGIAAPGERLSPTAFALPASPLVQVPAINIAPQIRAVPHLYVTNTHHAANGIQSFASQPVWASYLGGPGDDRLLGVALNPAPNASQPVVVTGFTQNASDPTEFDGVVATLSTDGTTATVSTIGFGTGTRTEGHGVDVDSAGNIYVIGQTGQTSDPSTTTDLIVRVDSTGSVTWVVSLTPANSTGAGNGVKLDAAGTNLFLSGGINGNLFVAKLTELASAQPSLVYGSVFALAAGATVGNGVGPDSAGDADVAFTLTTAGDNFPGWGQVTPDGSSLMAGAFDSLGPKAGMFGITVDASDNFYVTGAIGLGDSPFTVLVVSKFNVNVNRQYAVGWSLTDSSGVRIADWIGRGISVDSSGDAYMATVDDSGGGGNMLLFAVGPAGRTPLEVQGRAFGAKADQNRGLALDTSNNVLYMVGFTNSPDFNFTSGSFQSTYGGDPYDGVVIQDRLT
jgi:hypothetical protein